MPRLRCRALPTPPDPRIQHADPNDQNLSIHTTDSKHTVNSFLPPLLLDSLHADPLPTIADPLLSVDHIDTHYLVCVFTARTEAFPDPLFLGNCLAGRAPCHFPAVATSPEAPSWIPVPEQCQERTADSYAPAVEGTEGDELVKRLSGGGFD